MVNLKTVSELDLDVTVSVLFLFHVPFIVFSLPMLSFHMLCSPLMYFCFCSFSSAVLNTGSYHVTL